MNMMRNADVKKASSLLQQVLFSSIYKSRYYGLKVLRDFPKISYSNPLRMSGSGAGKDSTAGGSIRQAGGGLGKLGAAREDGYFYHKEKEQLQKIKKQLDQEKPALEQKKDK